MRKSKNLPLMVEQYPPDYKGYQFITLIQYLNNNYLCIIDNIQNNIITAYVLDYCAENNIDEGEIIEITNHWHETEKHRYPVSIEYSKHEKCKKYSPLLRSFKVDSVIRMVGPVYIFEMNKTYKVRKRRKKDVPIYIYIQRKVTTA